MAFLDDFDKLVGQTIMHCQRIEHDIKIMYASMLEGDVQQNYYDIKFLALGMVLADLQQLDNKNGRPYLQDDDYQLLKQIKNIRNWLAHSCYMDFMYDVDKKFDENYIKAYNKVLDFNNKLTILSNQVERVRVIMLKNRR